MLLAVRDVLQQRFVDVATVRTEREVVVHIGQKIGFSLLGGVGVNCVLIAVRVLKALRVLVERNLGVSHERVLDSAHFNPTSLRPAQEQNAGVGEGVELRK